MKVSFKRAAAAAVMAAAVVTGSLLAAAPAEAATSAHVVNRIHEHAHVAGKVYTVNFIVEHTSAKSDSFCKLVVRNPQAKALYSTVLTGGQCWAVHTIWTQREEPRLYRTFSSQHQLIATVREEVHEGKLFDRELNS